MCQEICLLLLIMDGKVKVSQKAFKQNLQLLNQIKMSQKNKSFKTIVSSILQEMLLTSYAIILLKESSRLSNYRMTLKSPPQMPNT